jgi:hypothetical protein
MHLEGDKSMHLEGDADTSKSMYLEGDADSRISLTLRNGANPVKDGRLSKSSSFGESRLRQRPENGMDGLRILW